MSSALDVVPLAGEATWTARSVEAPGLPIASTAGLVSRLRWIWWLAICSNALFVVHDLIAADPYGYQLWLVRLLQVLAIAAALIAINEARTRTQILAISLGVIGIVCATMAVAGTMRGSTEAVAILAVAIALGTGALVPWGWPAQLSVVIMTGAAILTTLSWLTGTLQWALGPNGLAVAMSLAGSVLVAHQLKRQQVQIATQQAQRAKVEHDLVEARKAAEKANLAKSDFLAVLSHEIRTPMNAVIGLTDVLLDSSLDDSQRQCAETVRDAGTALLSIINDILDFSKIEAGKLTLEPTDFDPREIIEGVQELFSAQAQEKRIELVSFVYRDVPALIRGDAGRFRQILVNLVSNAIKFTDAGEVLIRLKSTAMEAGQVVLRTEVSDTGIGLAPEAQTRIFEEFSQVDMSSVRRHQGTGLGLAICKRLVGMMAGDIGVQSESGRGSTFWFTARFDPPLKPPLAIAPTASTDICQRGPGRRVLVADDNPVEQRMMVRLLERLGYHAIAVGSGREAVEALLQTPYTAVLMDCRMPEMDGYQASAAIRDRERGAQSHTKIIGMSSDEDGVAADRCRSAGMDAFIAKPVGLTNLGAILRRLDAQLGAE